VLTAVVLQCRSDNNKYTVTVGILFKAAAVRRSRIVGRTAAANRVCYLHPGVGPSTVSEFRSVFHFSSRSAVRNCARNSCHDDVFTDSSLSLAVRVFYQSHGYKNEKNSIAQWFKNLNNRIRFSNGLAAVNLQTIFLLVTSFVNAIGFCTFNKRFFLSGEILCNKCVFSSK